MNRVSLMGRLTKDPDIHVSKGENPVTVAKYVLAVSRRYRSQGEETDFIQVVCFGKSAEFCEKYLKKGMRMGVGGRIQTGSYLDKDGVRKYTVDIIAEEHYFADDKKDRPSEQELEEAGAIEEPIPF